MQKNNNKVLVWKKIYIYIYVENKNFPVCEYIYLSNIDLY